MSLRLDAALSRSAAWRAVDTTASRGTTTSARGRRQGAVWRRHARPPFVRASAGEILLRCSTGGPFMPANPPSNMPRISPYLYYQDVGRALDWLSRAFGFHERMRMPGPDGKIAHAEMEYREGVIMLGCPVPTYK